MNLMPMTSMFEQRIKQLVELPGTYVCQPKDDKWSTFYQLIKKNPTGDDILLFSCKSFHEEGIDENNKHQPFDIYSIEVDCVSVANYAFSHTLCKDNYNLRYLKYKNWILDTCSDNGRAMYNVFMRLASRYTEEWGETALYQQNKNALNNIPKQKKAYESLGHFLQGRDQR